MQYQETLASMVGHVRRFKPNAPPDLTRDWLNYSQRTIINRRPQWAGLFKHATIYLPNVYDTGQVELITNSNLMLGTNTDWPVTDYISTSIPAGVAQPGGQWVTPASMDNIDDNSCLYVGDGETYPEIVPVRKVNQTQFYAVFKYPKNQNTLVWQSSLVHRQLRMTERNPIYNIIAVTSDSIAVLDKPWSGASGAAMSYQIVKMYITIASDCKSVMSCIDPIRGIQMEVNVPQARVNAADPWRQSVNTPIWLCNNYPNINGNETQEVYPPPTTSRQLNIMYQQEWPDMRAQSDIPLPFVAPNVLVWGALSHALRHKAEVNDPYYDPRMAAEYERQFENGIKDAMYADDYKAQMAYSWQYESLYGFGGADWWRAHDADVYYGNV